MSAAPSGDDSSGDSGGDSNVPWSNITSAPGWISDLDDIPNVGGRLRTFLSNPVTFILGAVVTFFFDGFLIPLLQIVVDAILLAFYGTDGRAGPPIEGAFGIADIPGYVIELAASLLSIAGRPIRGTFETYNAILRNIAISLDLGVFTPVVFIAAWAAVTLLFIQIARAAIGYVTP